MEIILLGKRLEDYPETEYYERRLIYTTYSYGFREYNITAFKSRLKKTLTTKQSIISSRTVTTFGLQMKLQPLSVFPCPSICLRMKNGRWQSRLLSVALKPIKPMSVCLTRCRLYWRSIARNGRIWVCAIPSCNVFLMNAGRDVLAGIARIRNKSQIIHEYQGKI